MATVETVLGPVDASRLGNVLSHEHIIVSNGEDWQHYPWLYDRQKTLDDAKDTVAMATCPAFRHRDRGHLYRTFLIVAAVLVGFYLFGMVLDESKSGRSSVGTTIFTLCGIVSAGVVGYMRWLKFAYADRRLVFVDPSEPETTDEQSQD
jgi:hypothetical protein